MNRLEKISDLYAKSPNDWTLNGTTNIRNICVTNIDVRYRGNVSSQIFVDWRQSDIPELIVALHQAWPAIEKALKVADEMSKTAKKAHKELENGYETCGLIVDMKNLAIEYESARKELEG